MDIKQEDFNKLKQLDRIEYRQKEERINSEHDESFGWIFLKFNLFIMLFGIFIILALVVSSEIQLAKDISFLFLKIIIFLSICMILGSMVDFRFLLISIKNLKELKESYFKIEVKK